jgi:hypothetical protein
MQPWVGLAVSLGASCNKAPTPDRATNPSDPAVEEKTILDLEHTWGQAYVKGDRDFVDRILAPEWHGWTDLEGSDKAAAMAESSQAIPQPFRIQPPMTRGGSPRALPSRNLEVTSTCPRRWCQRLRAFRLNSISRRYSPSCRTSSSHSPMTGVEAGRSTGSRSKAEPSSLIANVSNSWVRLIQRCADWP